MEFLDRLTNALFVLHPLHSMTVHFPIALTAAALLFTVLALWRRSEAMEQVAFYNLALATVSIVVAGLTGMRDNLARFDGQAPYVNVKLFLAISLLALTTAMVVGRWRKQDILWSSSTRVLYLAGYAGSFALAAVLGFLGGSILYGF